MIYPMLVIEEELFGELRLLSIRYQLPEDDWSSLELKAVELANPRLWDETGLPVKDLVIVDLLPVLSSWQRDHIAGKVLDVLKQEAEQEALAA